MISVASVYVALGGGYVQCRNPASFKVEACKTVVEISVVGLVGFGLTFFGVVWTIIGGLTRAGHLTPRQTESHFQVASVDEEKIFLATANQLLGEARLPRARCAGTIAWSQNLPRDACRFKREGFRKPSQLVLSAALRGTLAPEDWKTLMAYYFDRLKPRFSLVMRF